MAIWSDPLCMCNTLDEELPQATLPKLITASSILTLGAEGGRGGGGGGGVGKRRKRRIRRERERGGGGEGGGGGG